MDKKYVSVEKGIFSSKLLPIGTFTFILAAICSLSTIILLFLPASIHSIVKDIEHGQIYDPSAQQTWLTVYILFSVINCIGTVILASGLVITLCKKHYIGMNIIYYGAKYSHKGLTVFGILALVYFIYRIIRYTILCFEDINETFMALISCYAMEGIMFVLVFFIFKKFREFLDSCVDCSVSINYTLNSNKIFAPTIPPLSVSGFLYLGIIDTYLTIDRLFSFSYTQTSYNKVVYNVPLNTEPIHLISGLSFLFAAIGSILLYIYLRGYKSKCELLLARSQKESKE